MLRHARGCGRLPIEYINSIDYHKYFDAIGCPADVTEPRVYICLFAGISGIEDAKTRERAEQIARDLIEYINSIDYQKYFDAMGRPGSRGGDKEKKFSDFSIRAVDAAQVPSFAHAFLLSLHALPFSE